MEYSNIQYNTKQCNQMHNTMHHQSSSIDPETCPGHASHSKKTSRKSGGLLRSLRRTLPAGPKLSPSHHRSPGRERRRKRRESTSKGQDRASVAQTQIETVSAKTTVRTFLREGRKERRWVSPSA